LSRSRRPAGCTIEIRSASEAETRATGRRLAAALLALGGGCVALVGRLGAGKTVFVKGMAEALGVEPRRITSPTFVIMHVHATDRAVLYHADAYRVGTAAEFEEAISPALEKLHEGALLAVEWAERVATALPPDRITVRMEHLGVAEREISISGPAEALKPLGRSSGS